MSVIPNTAVTRSGSSPSGVTSSGPRSGQVPTARTTVGTARATAPARPSGHQRRDGSRPSGNSSTRNTTPMTMPGTKAQLATQLASSPPGSDSRRVVSPRARGAYCSATLRAPSTKPSASSSQASRWRRSRTTIRAPMGARTSASMMPMAWWLAIRSTRFRPLKAARERAATARRTASRHRPQASRVTAGCGATSRAAAATLPPRARAVVAGKSRPSPSRHHYGPRPAPQATRRTMAAVIQQAHSHSGGVDDGGDCTSRRTVATTWSRGTLVSTSNPAPPRSSGSTVCCRARTRATSSGCLP